jgi:hypothetical protein
MPLELDQQIVRRNDANFRLLDDRDITGGFHTVQLLTERNSILTSLRKVGMLVWVQEVPAMYQLNPDLVTWTLFTTSTGGGAVVTVTGNDPIWVDNTDPANPIVGPGASATAGSVIVSNGVTFEQRQLTTDDLAPPFNITSFIGGTGNAELGTIVPNPAFTAAYTAPLASATLNDGLGALPITLPATSFAYDGGVSGLPVRSYQRLTVNGGVTWTLTATKLGGTPIKTANVSANLGLTRRYFDIVNVPGAYNSIFIKGLGNNNLTTGFSGTYVFPLGTPTTKIYLCWPTAFGNPSSILGPAPFAFPMVKVATGVLLVNDVAPGYSIPGGYDVWESVNFITSAFTLVVS